MRIQEISYFVSLLVYIGAIAAFGFRVMSVLWLLILGTAAILIITQWRKHKSLLPKPKNYNTRIRTGLFFVNCSHIMFLFVIFTVMSMRPGAASGIFLLLPGLLWLVTAILGVSLVELGRRAATKSINTKSTLA
jgi:hypothetical protein